MKNYEVVTLVNAGVLQATAHEVAPAHAYKLYKLKKALEKALSAIQDAEKGLVKDAGIEDAQAFDDRGRELAKVKEEERKEEQKAEAEERNAKLLKFSELRKALYEDEAQIEGLKTVPYEVWFALQKENRAAKVNGQESDIFSGPAESILEGVFWTEPEGEE